MYSLVDLLTVFPIGTEVLPEQEVFLSVLCTAKYIPSTVAQGHIVGAQ